MDNRHQDTAFLVRPDGRAVVGHGPFVARPRPPARGAAFYVNDFSLAAAEPWRVPSSWQELAAEELPGLLESGVAPEWLWREPEAAAFATVFHEVAEAIRRGAFEKTVPVVVEDACLAGGEARGIAAMFARARLPHMPYGWYGLRGGFAGATPELLFSLAGGVLRTMALAGTARIEEADILASDEKEIREHEYVAQALVAKLADLGRVTRGERRVLQLGSIVHFLTPIEVVLDDGQGVDGLLRRLHPTPALGPLPRVPETMAMLEAWRQRLGCPPGFGAPFGAWVDGVFDAVVCIRGVWWDGTTAKLPAGCGVIEASRMVSEWRELRLKRDAVKQMLAQGEVAG